MSCLYDLKTQEPSAVLQTKGGNKTIDQVISDLEGEMIEKVTLDNSTWNEVPYKLEAGTPNYIQAIGLGAAVKYLKEIGMNEVRNYEETLTSYELEKLQSIPNIYIHGNPKKRGGVVSFTIEGIHPHDIATILDEDGIAIRAGHHCCQILHDKLNIPATARASFGVYNTKDDIDRLNDGINNCKKIFEK